MATEPTQPGICASGAQTENLLDNLSSLSDDQFFQRLSALRTEHKKTLMHYEQLYHEKLMAETGGDIGKIFGEPLFSESSQRAPESRQSADGSERPKPASSLTVSGVGVTMAARTPSPSSKEPEPSTSDPHKVHFTDFERPEPPTLESLGRDYDISVHQPVNTGADTFNQHLEVLRKSGEKPPRSPCPVHKTREAWTEDQNQVEEPTRDDSSGDEIDYENYDENRYQKDKNDALDRIGRMWDDFSLDDYKERRRSTDRRSSGDDWRHRITMPKPFKMTLRDESKPRHKSRTLAEYEHQRALNDMEERFECEKKFRARPVPAHVYLPLYDEMTEQAETRRRNNVQVSKQVLKSQEKPFKFHEREKVKPLPNHARRHSAPIVKQKQFKAKPIPKSVRDDVTERILEEEEYRKIRIRMRAKELMKTSSLPPRMASREQYTVGKLKEKIVEEKERAQPKRRKNFQPRIKKKVPDFETIHRKQRNESANRYKNKPEPQVVTVCEPFNLHSTSNTLDRVKLDMMKDEEELVESRWPYKNPRAKPKLGEVRRSYDALPTQTTTAAELRMSKNYDSIRARKADNDRENREYQEELARCRKRQIAEKARANDQSQELRASNAERIRRFREEERSRLEEYKKELAAMESRVNQRPFLFERQSQLNARKRAEKRFEDALRASGVDEQSLSSLTRGPRQPDDVLNLTDDDIDDDMPTHDVTDDVGGGGGGFNVTFDKDEKTDGDGDDGDDGADYQYTQSFEDDADDDVPEDLPEEIPA